MGISASSLGREVPMFVGHYGPSLGIKALDKSIPLWLLFLAVQFIDILWSIFVLLGIEKVRIVPGFTATNPFDLYFMPYTHALVASLLWAFLVLLGYRLVAGSGKWAAAALMGAAVFSHWILDLIVHTQDLPLFDEAHKMGLGLWNHPVPAFALEVAILFGGMYLYLRSTEATTLVGRYGMVIFGVLMLGIQSYVFFGPPPSSDKAAAVTALASYFIFAAVAFWLERKRSGSRD